MSEGAQNSFLAIQNDIGSDSRITEVTATVTFQSPSSYFTSTEREKDRFRTACLLTGRHKRERDELSKRDVSENSKSLECQLVPEKSVEKMTAADGSPCTSFQDNAYGCTCVTSDNQNKPCCSTPCVYQDKLKDYQCYSGLTQIECSPQYSLIAINGKRCRDDHPCATYGKDYYWCYTRLFDWEYCSPPLWQSRAKDGKYCRSDYACAKYHRYTPWCYTDDNNNWDYCCTSDDCFSAVNYKTCKPDHQCGYHGKKYLWCYTTDDDWDYCCKPCTY